MIGEWFTIVYPHEENCEFHRHQGKIWVSSKESLVLKQGNMRFQEKVWRWNENTSLCFFTMTGDQSGKDSSSETAYGKNGNLLQWFIPTSKICDGDILYHWMALST